MTFTHTGNAYARSARNYDRNAASTQSGLLCRDPSLTQQSQKEQADINTIVRNFGVTGKVPVTFRTPLLVDFDAPLDYRMMVDAIRDAEQQFAKLPAAVKKRFANDPGEFVAFCENPDNVDELRRMGLAREKQNVIVAESRGPGPGPGSEAAPPEGGR